MRNDLSAGFLVMSIGDVILDPETKALQNGLVFLYNEQPWTLFGSYAQMHRCRTVEVPFFGTVGSEVRTNCRVTVNLAYTDYRNVVQFGFGLITEKPFVKTHLRL